MKTKKGIISTMLAIVCCFLAVFGNVHAASAITEVQIEIEGSEMLLPEEDKDVVDEGNMKKIPTGDERNPKLFIGIAVIAAVCILLLLLKKRNRRRMFVVLLALCGVLCIRTSAEAAGNSDNVSVTIPGKLSIVFEENGTNGIGDFKVSNQSAVPITLNRVYVTEYNGWKLKGEGEKIPTDTKEFGFRLENECLVAGENDIEIVVPEQTEKELTLDVFRGAWTTGRAAETAMKLEFEYEIGAKEFTISFNSNGGSGTIAPMRVLNGAIVTLPVVTKFGYALVGWQDAQGTVYTDTYTMPIGDVTLKAIWVETKAYAIYSATDQSLTFCRSKEPIQVGSTRNGKTVTAVYTGFEDTKFTSSSNVSWYPYRGNIKKVIVEDTIRPISLEYWFVSCVQCSYLDVGKIDTSRVTSMRQTFSLTGRDSTSKVTILGVDKWDTSKVTTMQSMFNATGKFAPAFYMDNISGWDTSNVTTMVSMFVQFAMTSQYVLDLRGWDVRNVQKYGQFNSSVTNTVVAPKWVY